MSLRGRISAAWDALRASPENPSTNLSNPDDWLSDWMMGGGPSQAGVRVNQSSAMGVTAYYRGVCLLSGTVGGLPGLTYERQEDGGRRRAVEHPIYSLIHDEPNSVMSSFTYFETGTAHVVSEGNHYAFIERDGQGRPVGLWPIPPTTVEPRLEGGRLVYLLSEKVDGKSALLPSEVVHVPGLGYDGVRGYNPVHLARESLGTAIATERAAGQFFGNSSRPSGVLETENTLTREKADEVKKRWNQAHKFADGRGGGTAVLGGGLKWRSIQINQKDAQFLEQRKFQVAEVARLLGIPPHMLADLDRATFSNIEHQAIEFVTYSLRPWLLRWERELNRKLFTREERKRYFIEFLVDALLRGDIKSRFEAYSLAIQNKIMKPNEARIRENLNPEPWADSFPINVEPPAEESGDE